MASPLTRSSRRSEGLTTRSSTRNNVAITPAGSHNKPQQPNIGRKKRPRDPADHEDVSITAKKARISIEITSQPKAQPKTRSLVINAKADAAPRRSASPPKHAKPKAPPQAEPPLPPPQKPTNHHQKVVNGIKHELDRLQPSSADLKAEKRKLRSQEGTRFKSELSAYFPEYDEVIGNEPKEDREFNSRFCARFDLWLIFKDILNLDTPIIIIDSAKTNKQPASPRKSNGQLHEYPLKEFPDSLFETLHDAQRVDFSFLDKHYKEEGGKDPLSDEYFESIHRKPERQEKAIRNSDKGRAQHERDQVIRLLEGLQGHDWLKLMGVSGITESKKKDYESAREHFIKGCEAILEKFRLWREEEKRRKLEKELAAAEAEQAEEEEEEEAEEEEGEEEEEEEAVPEDGEDDDQEGNISDGDPPDYSDVDASAARQLHEEAIARSAPLSKHSEKKAKVEPFPTLVPKFEKEFTSFFAKPYLRAAALGKHRRSGRSVAAWGHPVPDVTEADFDLPEEYRDEETLKVHARRKRRDRRVSKS
jgi:Something about silencing, SAS, complex subunit 4